MKIIKLIFWFIQKRKFDDKTGTSFSLFSKASVKAGLFTNRKSRFNQLSARLGFIRIDLVKKNVNGVDFDDSLFNK